MQKCPSTAGAKRLLGETLERGGLRRTDHFLKQLAERNLDILDAREVMRSGEIYQPPEQDPKTGEWVYKIEGWTSDRDWLVIVFRFGRKRTAVLITIYEDETRRR